MLRVGSAAGVVLLVDSVAIVVVSWVLTIKMRPISSDGFVCVLVVFVFDECVTNQSLPSLSVSGEVH